jgi:SAM-dependent methyltransferase
MAGERVRARFQVPDLERGLRTARLLFERGDHREALDLYEQLAEDFEPKEAKILAEAYDQIQRIPQKDSRYHLYVSRFFDFDIRPGDKVLDIGSGNLPFPFATHLADRALTDHHYGRAGEPFKHVDGKPVYECDVADMPFADREFDFVNCSHVLEHTEDPEKACRELSRVGKRGYVETPAPGKDLWLHSAKSSNHRWAVTRRGDTLVFDEYGPEDLEGIGTCLLASMHWSPRTRREKALSALVYLKAPFMNTMLYWEGSIRCEVRRRSAAPSRPAPAVRPLPDVEGLPPVAAALGALRRARAARRFKR